MATLAGGTAPDTHRVARHLPRLLSRQQSSGWGQHHSQLQGGDTCTRGARLRAAQLRGTTHLCVILRVTAPGVWQTSSVCVIDVSVAAGTSVGAGCGPRLLAQQVGDVRCPVGAPHLCRGAQHIGISLWLLKQHATGWDDSCAPSYRTADRPLHAPDGVAVATAGSTAAVA